MSCKFFRRSLLGMLFGTVLSIAAYAEELVTVMSPTMFRVPYGDSVFDLPKIRMQNSLTYLRVVYSPSVSCPEAPKIALNVKYLDDDKWQTTTFLGNGMFQLRDVALTGVRFLFKQTAYLEVTCQLQVMGGQKPYQENFAGIVHYSGGFINRQGVKLNGSFTTQTVTLKIPQYCNNLEIAEVGTMAGENFVAAGRDRSVPGKYWFGSAVVLDSLYITLNGPLNNACDIPIYVTTR